MMLFNEYLNRFMQIFLDNFTIYGERGEHHAQLRLCL